MHATGFVALHPPAGKLSFVSQSGSMGPTVINMCERRDIGLDKFISVGNEAQVSAFDVLDYLRDDPDTECVMLYLEGIDDGRHFFDAARRTTAEQAGRGAARRAHRVGRQGRRLAHRRAGRVRGRVPAAARQAGVVTCGTTQDLVDLGACLAYLPLPRGRRVAVVTNGGGPGVLAADEVALNGLELADAAPGADRRSRRGAASLLEQAQSAGPGRRRLRRQRAARLWSWSPGATRSTPCMFLNFLGRARARRRPGRGWRTASTRASRPWETAMLEKTAELMEETGKPIIHVPDHPGPRRTSRPAAGTLRWSWLAAGGRPGARADGLVRGLPAGTTRRRCVNEGEMSQAGILARRQASRSGTP